MTSLLDDLNPHQREAVTHGEGPLLVLAGAGSGKTRVLTYRIAHLLEQKVARSFEVTAVTFTNKAAREMRERVEALLGSEVRGGFVGTFHRWSLDVLRRHPRAAGLSPRFAIADSDDQRVLANRALKELGLDPREVPPRAVLSRISGLVNRGVTLASFQARAGGHADDVLAQVWERYVALKTRSEVVDFDDMLVHALRAIRADDAVRAEVSRRARFLLVDEFQDTNSVQMELLGAVLDGERNVTAVGDEDQSIYRWRGAELDNILEFERFFPGARVVVLEENYRSTAPILRVAADLIANNHGRRDKRLFTSRRGGVAVELAVSDDERSEARWVADRIETLRETVGLRGMSVLMRTNAQTRPFEEELTRRHVPHRVVGGLRFWQRSEIKDALAYLRLSVRPEDVLSFERVVNVPARGIGAATMDVLRREAADTGCTTVEAARRSTCALSDRARIALDRFFALLEEAQGRREELEPGDYVGWLLEASGLLAMYEGDAEEKVARRENLQQLAAAVAEAAASGEEIASFLDAVSLLEDDEEGSSTEGVSLMTLHSAKGLEFDVVFLAGLEDGLLPHASSRDEIESLEEERRLAYVGLTRARQRLFLTAARSRFLFGRRHPTCRSRFLDEIPATALDEVSPGLSVAMNRDHSSASPVAVDAARPLKDRNNRRSKPARKPIHPTVNDEAGIGWRPGDRVRHRRFGSGVVLACQGRGPGLKLVVFFDRAGRKILVPTIAKLEKI